MQQRPTDPDVNQPPMPGIGDDIRPPTPVEEPDQMPSPSPDMPPMNDPDIGPAYDPTPGGDPAQPPMMGVGYDPSGAGETGPDLAERAAGDLHHGADYDGGGDLPDPKGAAGVQP